MEKLVLERTSPIQGEPVNVYFHSSSGHCGQVVLTYEEWLHFNKLIKEGQESLKKKHEQKIEIEIKGIGEVKGKAGLVPQVRRLPKVKKEISDMEVDAILGGISSPLELDQEDEKEIEKSEKEQGLVRSLIGVNNAGN